MRVKCTEKRKVNPYCFNRNMDCPANCPQSCYPDCNTCKPVCVCNTPGACGDPRFIGGDGNAFYFHGRRDADFCVVSDRDLHINAHFIGKSGHSGMSRDFTWIQAIAVLFDGHRLYLGARKTGTWDDAVEHLDITLDGEHVYLPADLIDVQPRARAVRDPHQGDQRRPRRRRRKVQRQGQRRAHHRGGIEGAPLRRHRR
ncbi:hypothetical protein VPH35_039465 [Triticum aestivum]